MADLSKSAVLSRGVNRRDLDKEFIRLGGTVRPVERTGEVEYLHPSQPLRHRVNSRKKTAPLTLIGWVQKIRREQTIR